MPAILFAFRALAALCAAVLALPCGAAGKGEAAPAELTERARLERQLRSLERLRAEKLSDLEKAEAARWDARYRQEAEVRDWEEEARRLEDEHSRLAQALARAEESLIQTQGLLRDRKAEWEGVLAARQGFHAFVRALVEEDSRDLASDIPVGMARRMRELSRAGEFMAADDPSPEQALEHYFAAQRERYRLTLDQALESRAAILEDGREVPVWRLRMGTVWAGEMEKGGPGFQLLLRTGSLKGRSFAWRGDLPGEKADKARAAIRAAVEGKSRVEPPLDVLQNRSLDPALEQGRGEKGLKALTGWFGAGGVVMYPIVLVALFAIALSLGRLIFFFRRGTAPDGFMRGLRPLLDQGRLAEAREYCLRSGTSLGDTLAAILGRAGQGRESAEKTAREAMLREIPALEKWMALIATLAAVAPLMGLLGTVSGMITLFQVITSQGTNDPRILAGGISEALVTTQAGLVIAIPVLLVHGMLSNRLDNISAALNVHSLEVLNRLWPEGKEGA